ncbi:uncharacterized protein Bfra_011377 [Botrytis fragariae]|uniref:Uncharacterized protein n=1 Tax=Botrytis fragariae TaxID=1964551 RepID=A0A8H6AY38_9HELO|nr:uncharacterized protein Bfra_011377 [Botrytis fragariae]KAF5875615.1 hypothetical protein Bfra_011377 [Botrytis fragariae]
MCTHAQASKLPKSDGHCLTVSGITLMIDRSKEFQRNPNPGHSRVPSSNKESMGSSSDFYQPPHTQRSLTW